MLSNLAAVGHLNYGKKVTFKSSTGNLWNHVAVGRQGEWQENEPNNGSLSQKVFGYRPVPEPGMRTINFVLGGWS